MSELANRYSLGKQETLAALCDKKDAQIESLQAENERLIFALERVKSNTMYGKNFPDLEDYKQAANRAHEIAKTALTNPPID